MKLLVIFLAFCMGVVSQGYALQDTSKDAPYKITLGNYDVTLPKDLTSWSFAAEDLMWTSKDGTKVWLDLKILNSQKPKDMLANRHQGCKHAKPTIKTEGKFTVATHNEKGKNVVETAQVLSGWIPEPGASDLNGKPYSAMLIIGRASPEKGVTLEVARKSAIKFVQGVKIKKT
ncbi:hypothetical protein JNK13_05980 [bacterium]|nr:hypothetical protein [bacterium]